MEEKPRLEVLTTPSNFDGVRLQTEKAIEKNRDFFNFKMSQVPHMEVAIDSLKKGTGDLLAMSVKDWKKYDVEGLKISAFYQEGSLHGYWYLMTSPNIYRSMQ